MAICLIFSFALSAACLLLLDPSACWIPSIRYIFPSSVATDPLISSGHTKLSGLSMWWPLCSKVTPLITPSLPRTCRITLPFFHFPRFFFFFIPHDKYVFSNVWYWGFLPIYSMAFQQTVYIFVLSSSPRMLFGFPQSLVKFAYFISVFFGFFFGLLRFPLPTFCPHIKTFGVKTCSHPLSLS